MRPYQEGGHAKQQHVYKVCCAKLEGDLLQLGAILYAAWSTQPDQIPATVKQSSSAGKHNQRETLEKRVDSSTHIQSTLSKKGKDGFPKNMKQVSSLQICMADGCCLQGTHCCYCSSTLGWSQVESCGSYVHGIYLELSHYQWP